MNLALCLLVAASAHAPETWFHVIGGNASREGMVADIAAIAEAGISGIQFFHGAGEGTWPGVTNPIPCLSERWVELVKCAETECHRRGLTFKMQNCPGWSMSGGPWITPDKAMRKLVAFEPVKRPRFEADEDYREICTITFPLEDSDDISVSPPNPSYLNHAWSYEPETRFIVEADGERIYERDYPQGAWQDDAWMTWRIPHARKYGTNLQFFVESTHFPRKRVEAPIADAVMLDNWEAKAFRCLREFKMETDTRPIRTNGVRTLVFGHVNMRRRNAPAPPEATGWECDKMSPEGFQANFDGYLGRLIKAGVKIDGTLVDSWECNVPNWTWRMEAEFMRRTGYPLRPWLPALFGYTLKSPAATESFLLDWRNVCSRLIEENYFGAIARLASEHHMRSQYETAFGDVLPGDILRFWKFADEPMCEFWHPHGNRGFVGSYDFKPALPCVSAAHLYGKRRVSAESLTSFNLTYNENFREWKRTIDKHLCRGITHVVFHTYTHNPVVNGKPPSTSFGSNIGSPFLRLQPWWPYLKEFTAYLEFCGRELERGLPVVDILMYLGDAVGHKPHENQLLFENRYKYDYLNPDVLQNALAVKEGRIVVDSYPAHASQRLKMSYRVLWVPKGTYVSAASARKLDQLEQAGARIVYGDFSPDWPSPLTAIGRDARGGLEWYQRRDGEEDVFFLVDRHGRSSFVRGKPGAWVRVDPVTRVDRPLNEFILDYALPVTNRVVEMMPVGRPADWATRRVYFGELPPFPDLDIVSATLDFGDVRDWASVKLGDREVARLWCDPYAVDITPYFVGATSPVPVRLEVTSTIYNQLAHDAGLPAGQRTTWTVGGPGKGAALAPAGLKGPVKLVIKYRKAPEPEEPEDAEANPERNQGS